MGEPPELLDEWRLYASEATVRVVNRVMAIQSKYWKCLRPEILTIDEASPPPERLNGKSPNNGADDRHRSGVPDKEGAGTLGNDDPPHCQSRYHQLH